jgi:2-polyprenyl-6-methoxyphenol hydroxylase-like FAD-dependent oxidoreductase
MTAREKHAIVLGGSMAGLLAARALSDHYQQVTIVERDELRDDAEPRRGAPQGQHTHGLLAGGSQALEAMFPGFLAGALARGALSSDIGDFCDWYVAGVPTLRFQSGLRGLLLSRPALECYVRELLLARGNVQIKRRRACGLIGDMRRVLGVAVVDHESKTAGGTLEADLVIDATGRGSQLPRWLKELGGRAPHEQRVRADVVYTSCYVRRRPDHFGGDDAFVVTPTPESRRGTAVLAVEGDRYLVTLNGYLGESCAPDYASMVAYARGIVPHDLYHFLSNAEPLSEPVQMRDPESRYRRYDRLAQFPEGLLVCGDALCSFNPAYAQGMSVAALQARALAACLSEAGAGLSKRFFRAATELLAAPWSIAAVADFAFPGVLGQRPFGTAFLNAYLTRVHRAAGRDARVAAARMLVTHLLADPATLFAPSIVARVLRFGGSGVRRLSSVSEPVQTSGSGSTP